MFFIFLHSLLWAANNSQLVELAKVDFSIKQEMVYATPKNFLKQKVYASPKCLLRKSVAESLSRVQHTLKMEGLGLKVWDCYRPLSIQKKMWELKPDARYVSFPATGSKHNRGAAVDVTLVGKDGEEMEMPTSFDDFTERAHRGYRNASKVAQRNSRRLEEVMKKEGFIGLPTEWWHFDHESWEKFSVEDTPIE